MAGWRLEPGGRWLAHYLRELQQQLWDYFGQLNEISLGLKPKPEDRIEKPQALVRYELTKELVVPYVAGGLQDQPFIWIKEHSVIRQFLQEWGAVQAIQNRDFSTTQQSS